MSERKNSINTIFKNNFFDLEYISEFDKEAIKNLDISEFYENNRNSYEIKSVLWDKDNKYRELTSSEISCQLKHLKALELSAQNDKEISLIIEDDVLPLKGSFVKKIKKILMRKNDWDILFIGQGIGKKFILKKINKKFKIISKEFDVSHPATNCAESYLIKNHAAQKLINNYYPFNLPYDWELAYKIKKLGLKTKWLYPPIFYQGSITGKFNSQNRIN